jgi:EAL domain-containing protein (putative c-di-GMP-specific phosphodiesterase class I)/ActR/RegA family two-component response regulator
MSLPEVFRAVPEQTVLIVDDDPRVCESVAALLERRGRHTIVCRDVEAAQLVIERCPVTHVLSDMKFTGPFRFEGLDMLDFVKRTLTTASVIIMTGNASEELRTEAQSRGADAVLQKPFALADLEQFVPPPISDSPAFETFIPTLDEILTGEELTSYFQPLVLTNQPSRAAGFEALARLPSIPLLNDPELLFRYAMAKGRVVDLEMAAATRSIMKGRELTRLGVLSINIHPEAFNEADRLSNTIMAACADAEISPERVVLEITEQGPLPNVKTVEAVAAVMRSHGLRFAFDDVGSAYSHLRAMEAVQPSYLKISQYFGTHCEADPTNRKIVENVLALAKAFSAQVVLEGIETEATAQFARELGIPLGQGFYYSRPVEVPTLLKRFA